MEVEVAQFPPKADFQTVDAKLTAARVHAGVSPDFLDHHVVLGEFFGVGTAINAKLSLRFFDDDGAHGITFIGQSLARAGAVRFRKSGMDRSSGRSDKRCPFGGQDISARMPGRAQVDRGRAGELVTTDDIHRRVTVLNQGVVLGPPPCFTCSFDEACVHPVHPFGGLGIKREEEVGR